MAQDLIDLKSLNNIDREKLIQDLTLREAVGLTGSDLNRRNPFLNLTIEEKNDPYLTVLRFMRNPDFFYFTCKYLFGISLFPYQCVILMEMWYHPFPMLIGTRGGAKSMLLGIYSLLRATFIQGRQIIIMGAGFRQAKAVYNYAEKQWNKSPVFRSLFDSANGSGFFHGTDMWTAKLGESLITALPQGDGEKIRGQRCNDLLVDEFKSINREIYDEVAMGFTIVSADPFEKVKSSARVRVLEQYGLWNEEMAEVRRKTTLTNQTIISGTAYYQFNHFYGEYVKYKHIIESGGDQDYIKEKTGKPLQEGLDYRDYCVIKMPADMLPKDYMDPKIIAKIQMSSTRTSFLNEVMACFSSDTNGFYRMTLLKACTTDKPIQVGESEEYVHPFRALLEGNPGKEYVIAIDPASEADNLAIVVLELNGTHRKIVYCWTTNNKQFKKQVEKGFVNPDFEYYGYCVRKIRTLMKKFNTIHIALDSQGGGAAIRNGLADKKLIEEGESPIYPLHSSHPFASDKYKDTDNKTGLHILEMVNFASADWTSEANHGMKFDFETRKLLFPKFDSAYLAQYFELNKDKYSQDEELNMDTMDDCYEEIELLKEETSTIEMRPTPMGQREKWDTPEDKASGKKGRQYKDRFCALLMANAAARSIDSTQKKVEYVPMGGFVGTIKHKKDADQAPEQMYHGPDWFTRHANGRGHYGGAIVH